MALLARYRFSSRNLLRTGLRGLPIQRQSNRTISCLTSDRASMDTALTRATKDIVEPQIAVAVRIVIDQIVAATVPRCGHARDLIVRASLLDRDSRAAIPFCSRARKVIQVAALAAETLSFFLASDQNSDLLVAGNRGSENLILIRRIKPDPVTRIPGDGAIGDRVSVGQREHHSVARIGE